MSQRGGTSCAPPTIHERSGPFPAGLKRAASLEPCDARGLRSLDNPGSESAKPAPDTGTLCSALPTGGRRIGGICTRSFSTAPHSLTGLGYSSAPEKSDSIFYPTLKGKILPDSFSFNKYLLCICCISVVFLRNARRCTIDISDDSGISAPSLKPLRRASGGFRSFLCC